MKVKWTEEIRGFVANEIMNSYPEANLLDFDKHYEGEVLGSTKGFWGDTYLTVMCTDGKVRECEISKARQI